MAFSPSSVVLALACAALVPVSPTPAPRVEYFVAHGADGEPQAVIAWRRLVSSHGVLLERDITFAGGALRVLHDERFDLDSPRLVWRELRGGAGKGRTWLAEETRPGELRTISWGTHAPIHGSVPVEVSPRMPLELVEELRAGTAPAACTWLDPLAVQPVAITIESGHELPAGCPEERLTARLAGARPWCLTLRREDGTVARRFVFGDSGLVGYQWADGAPWAVRVDAAEGRQLDMRWRSARPVEADAGVSR